MRKSNFLTAILALFFMGLTVQVNAQEIAAQSVTCIPATTLTCVDDPLHPFAGQEYEYAVSVTPPEGNYTWFVTTDVNILGENGLTTTREAKAGTIVASASDNYDVATANTVTDANKVKITWKSTTTNPVLLVMYVEGTGDTCADNLKVYKIEPKNAFALEIANLDPTTGTTAGANANSSCVSKVESASFDGTNMVYDYGENYLYFIVNAANFNTSWTPSFLVEGLDGTYQTAEVSYAKSNTLTTWLSTTETAGTFTGETAVTPLAGTDVGKDGECIVVRVKVDHSKYELIADQPITLKVDGVTADGQKDVQADCTEASDMADSSTQTILKRPTITSTTTGTGADFISPLQ